MLNQLKNLGLSENESRVYMAMLELGPATMLEISAKAGINRPTAYVQIESLKQKGLVSTQTKGKKNLFIGESPSQLEALLDRQEGEIEKRKEELAKILPELATLFKLGDSKPEVRFYEGFEGIKKANEEFIRSGAKETFSITSLDDVLRVFPDLLEEKKSKRVVHKIPAKVIYTSNKGAILPANDPERLREAKYVQSDKLPLSVDIAVFADKVTIVSYKGKLSATIITNEEIANSFRSLFHLFWSQL